jgi:NAD(P)-dependent dehydrogenase (short-subunit alcohol dehydrogenase family)
VVRHRRRPARRPTRPLASRPTASARRLSATSSAFSTWSRAGSASGVNAVAPQLIDAAANRATFSAELLTHAVRPEAIANVIAFLAGDLAAPVSGVIVPAYGA